MAGSGSGSKVGRGLAAVAAIVGLAAGLAVLASLGRPRVLRKPAAHDRPVLLIPDFLNRSGAAELTPFAGRLTEEVRERLGADRDGIFRVSPRRLIPVFSDRERESGLSEIAGRLGADYALVGSLEAGPGGALPPGSAWAPLAPAGEDGEEVRLEVLLVRSAERPQVFAERFPLGDPERLAAGGGAPERLARLVADRIALSLRRP